MITVLSGAIKHVNQNQHKGFKEIHSGLHDVKRLKLFLEVFNHVQFFLPTELALLPVCLFRTAHHLGNYLAIAEEGHEHVCHISDESVSHLTPKLQGELSSGRNAMCECCAIWQLHTKVIPPQRNFLQLIQHPLLVRSWQSRKDSRLNTAQAGR